MKINSLAKLYHDRFYHSITPNWPAATALKHPADHSTPDYIVHLSPEALRLHRAHVALSNKLS